MIMANLPLFVLILVLMVAAIWTIIGWSYSSVLSSKNAQMQLQDRQLADYKEKLQGATPDQAKARIDELEARLGRIEPRRLTDAQRAALATNLRLPFGTSYSIAVESESSGDCPQFAADFSAAFTAARNWAIVEITVMGIGNRPPHGIAVQFADLNQPPPEAIIVMQALRSLNIQFDIQADTNPRFSLSLLICTKILR